MTKWLTAAGRDPQDLVDIRPELSLEKAQQIIAKAEADRFEMINYGVDTNWGWADLRMHGTILLDVPIRRAVRSFLESPIVMDDPHIFLPRRTLRRRRWRIKYENYFDAQKLLDLADPSVWVPVDRTQVPINYLDALEKITD